MVPSAEILGIIWGVSTLGYIISWIIFLDKLKVMQTQIGSNARLASEALNRSNALELLITQRLGEVTSLILQTEKLISANIADLKLHVMENYMHKGECRAIREDIDKKLALKR